MEGMMEGEKETVIAAGLKAPRAGAIAGILFSILLIICVVLIRLSVPDSPADPGTWLSHSAKSVRLALNLLPFAGISFLWFIGVLRDRMFYSRIGFVHEFRTLEEKEITELLNQGWVPVGVTLPNEVRARRNRQFDPHEWRELSPTDPSFDPDRTDIEGQSAR
jgi:hypothetical protein